MKTKLIYRFHPKGRVFRRETILPMHEFSAGMRLKLDGRLRALGSHLKFQYLRLFLKPAPSEALAERTYLVEGDIRLLPEKFMAP